MRAIVIAGMEREVRAIGRGAVAWRSEQARRALGAANDGACVVIAGVCGGLDPSLSPGALILSRVIVADDAPDLVPDRTTFEAARRSLRARRAPFVSSKLLTVAEPLEGVAAQTDAWNAHGAAGVDMETYDIARECHARGVSWVAVRAVLDPAGSRLPLAAANWRDDGDERAIALDALRTPRDWPAYARLALQLRASLRALQRAMPAVIEAIERVDPLPDAADAPPPLSVARNS